MFTKTQIKVILVLMDDVGYAERELARALDMAESNLNPHLKALVKMGVIFKGELRDSEKEPSLSDKEPKNREYVRMRKKGMYYRFPYFIKKDLYTLEIIIKEIQRKKPSIAEIMFLINAILKSKYGTEMRNKFSGDKIQSIVDGVIFESGVKFRESPIYTDVAKHTRLYQRSDRQRCDPELSWELNEIEMWYCTYLSSTSSQEEGAKLLLKPD